jgi:DNA-binding NtrC family response regulator
MPQQKEILIVDDEVGIRELLSEILQDEGYQVSVAENAGEARNYRLRTQPALVLLDIWMPDTDGVTLLREWAANGQLTMPVVMMSGHGTIETAVEATKVGAFDFLEKPVGLQKLLSTVTRALKTAAGQGPRRISLAALGTSTPVIEVERAIEQLLRASRPVLIVGEPGAGHDIAARALHVPDAPFVILANGARLAANPSQVLRKRATGCSTASKSAPIRKRSRKGWPSFYPSWKSRTRFWCAPAASSSATSRPRAGSTRRCCRSCPPARSCCRRCARGATTCRR